MSQNLDPQALSMLFAVGGTILFVLFALIIVLYLLQSIGLYKMAQKSGIPLAGLAFVPIANQYVLGKLLKGNFTVFGMKIGSPEIVLPVTAIVGSVLSGVPVLGFIAVIVLVILSISSIYHMYRKYKGDSATVLTIVTVIFSIIYPFMIFSMRNADPVDPSYDEGGFGGSDDYNNYNNY